MAASANGSTTNSPSIQWLLAEGKRIRPMRAVENSSYRNSLRNDQTIYTEDIVPIEALQLFVSSIVRHIAVHYRKNSLFLFDDWHAHDGFIVLPKEDRRLYFTLPVSERSPG
jgi:hypothetical protein